MPSVVITGVHLLATGLGLWLIWRLSRTALPAIAFHAITAALCAAIALYVFLVSEPPNLFEDFKDAYLAAGRAVLSGPAALEAEIKLGSAGFVNLPIVAYLFSPFALAPQRVASLAFLLLGAACVLGAWWMTCRHYAFNRTESALALFALSSFGPLLYSFREGNTSHMLLLALVGGLVLAQRKREFAAGAVFAAAAIIKPPLLLIGVLYGLRGRWRIVAGGLAMCVCALALSLLVFGWDMHALWIQQFSGYASAPMPGFNSQSLASEAARFVFGPSSYWDWSPHALPAFVRVAVLGATLALLGLGVLACLRATTDRDDLDLWMLLTFICIASTVSWSHYYVWLLPGFAFAYARTKSGSAPAWSGAALLGAFVLAMPAVYLQRTGVEGSPALFTDIVVSHLLMGGLIFYVVLARLGAGALIIRRSGANAPSAAS